MSKLRSKIGSKLFKLAAKTYVPGNAASAKVGNLLFKLAAKVSPDKK